MGALFVITEIQFRLVHAIPAAAYCDVVAPTTRFRLAEMGYEIIFAHTSGPRAQVDDWSVSPSTMNEFLSNSIYIISPPVPARPALPEYATITDLPISTMLATIARLRRALPMNIGVLVACDESRLVNS